MPAWEEPSCAGRSGVVAVAAWEECAGRSTFTLCFLTTAGVDPLPTGGGSGDTMSRAHLVWVKREEVIISVFAGVLTYIKQI